MKKRGAQGGFILHKTRHCGEGRFHHVRNPQRVPAPVSRTTGGTARTNGAARTNGGVRTNGGARREPVAVRGTPSVPTGSFYKNGGGAGDAKAARIIATLASQYHRPLRRHSGKKTALLAIRLWLVTHGDCISCDSMVEVLRIARFRV